MELLYVVKNEIEGIYNEKEYKEELKMEIKGKITKEVIEKKYKKKMKDKKRLFISQLIKMLSYFNEQGEYENTYKMDFCRKIEEVNLNKIGRLQMYGVFSISKMKSYLRHYLLKNTKWVDIDIVNCHPCILNNLIKKYDINPDKYKVFLKYVNKREEVLNNLVEKYKGKYSRSIFKIIFIKIMNGMSRDNIRKILGDIKPLEPLFKETYQLRKDIIKHYLKENTNFKKEYFKKKELTLFSYILQTEEKRIMDVVFNFLLEKKIIKNNKNLIEYFVYCYDGFLFYNKNNTNIETLKNKLIKVVKEKLEYDVKWSIKEFKDNNIDKIIKRTGNKYKNKSLKDFFTEEQEKEYKYSYIFYKSESKEINIINNKDLLGFFKIQEKQEKKEVIINNIEDVRIMIFKISFMLFSIGLDYRFLLKQLNKISGNNFSFSFNNDNILTSSVSFRKVVEFIKHINSDIVINDYRYGTFYNPKYLLRNSDIKQVNKGFVKYKKSKLYGYYHKIGSHLTPFDDGIFLNKKRDVLEKDTSEVLILNGFFGSGKTYSYKTIIQNLRNTNKRTLIISPRRTLTGDLESDMKKEGIISYLSKEEDWRKNNKKGLIICFITLVSYLNKLNNEEKINEFINSFDLIIFDEITLTLNEITNYKISNGNSNYYTMDYFFRIIGNTENRIIISEGLMDKSVIDIIKIINKKRKLKILNNEVIRDDKKRSFIPLLDTIDDKNTFFNKKTEKKEVYLLQGLTDLLNKDDTRSYVYINNKKNITKLLKLINKDKNVLVYHTDIKDKISGTDHWDQYDIILTTSTLSVGVDYTGFHFNNMIIWIESFDNINEVIQSCYRIRNLQKRGDNKLPVIYYHFFNDCKKVSRVNNKDFNDLSFYEKYKKGDVEGEDTEITKYINTLKGNTYTKELIKKDNYNIFKYIVKEVYKFPFKENIKNGDVSYKLYNSIYKELLYSKNNKLKLINLISYIDTENPLKFIKEIMKTELKRKSITKLIKLILLVENYNKNNFIQFTPLLKEIKEENIDNKDIIDILDKYTYYISSLEKLNILKDIKNTLFKYYYISDEDNGNPFKTLLSRYSGFRPDEGEYRKLKETLFLIYKDIKQKKEGPFVDIPFNPFTIYNILFKENGFFEKEYINDFIIKLKKYRIRNENGRRYYFKNLYNLSLNGNNHFRSFSNVISRVLGIGDVVLDVNSDNSSFFEINSFNTIPCLQKLRDVINNKPVPDEKEKEIIKSLQKSYHINIIKNKDSDTIEKLLNDISKESKIEIIKDINKKYNTEISIEDESKCSDNINEIVIDEDDDGSEDESECYDNINEIVIDNDKHQDFLRRCQDDDEEYVSDN